MRIDNAKFQSIFGRKWPCLIIDCTIKELSAPACPAWWLQHISCTLYWHYWLIWLGLVPHDKGSFVWNYLPFHTSTLRSQAQQRLRLILLYTCTLLSSHYAIIAATAMDLYSCMSESDRQNGRKMPHPPPCLRKPQVWISTNKSDPIMLVLLL